MNDNMETTPRATTAAWEDITICGVGFWLFICPPTLVLHSSGMDMFGSVGAGLVTIILAAIAMRKDRLWTEWTLIAWGVALMALPWALGFVVKAGVTNAIACGIMVIALAAWRVIDLNSRRHAAVPVVPLAVTLADTVQGDERRAA